MILVSYLSSLGREKGSHKSRDTKKGALWCYFIRISPQPHFPNFMFLEKIMYTWEFKFFEFKKLCQTFKFFRTRKIGPTLFTYHHQTQHIFLDLEEDTGLGGKGGGKLRAPLKTMGNFEKILCRDRC